MPTRYVLVTLNVPEEQHDVATAILTTYPMLGIEVGMDSLTVSFDQAEWDTAYEQQLLDDLAAAGVSATVGLVGTEEDQNWNAEWEASIDPVIVNDRIAIVPEWRESEFDVPLKLVITPKMSFGTGHHATTRMMCRLMEHRVQVNDTWIDVGTGTGVLAILAVKLGARHVLAFDNNEWSVLNSQENIQKNGCEGAIDLRQDELGSIELPSCDGLAANLYRHLVVPYSPDFVRAVKPGGWIIVSGILKYDADDVIAPFLALGCTLDERIDESEWCAIAFRTPSVGPELPPVP